MKATFARILLEASGLAGAAGPPLAAACARLADALTAAAEWVAPLTTCPGCGGAVPSLDLEVVGVCGGCAEREAVGPATPLASVPTVAADPRVNVTRYHHRAGKPEEPS